MICEFCRSELGQAPSGRLPELEAKYESEMAWHENGFCVVDYRSVTKEES